MPWRETNCMDERIKFLSEYLRQERSMAALCREFGISRKTGHKWVGRYLVAGPPGLLDRSRAPRHSPGEITEEMVSAILALRQAHGHWGPRKLRAWLEQHRPRTVWPAASTIGRILTRYGMVIPRRRSRRGPPYQEPFRACSAPNAVWCADFKGWFQTGDGTRCDPLTITDAYSRYLLQCRVVPRTRYVDVRPVFERVFRDCGLPEVIRTDNGTPFASTGLGGLSPLSIWWIKLGIIPERIAPGCPEQNGRHERLHRTLKAETATPPQTTIPQQQQAFDHFRHEYNHERPHEAIGNRTPDSLYQPSPRPYPRRVSEVAYPDHLIIRRVRPCGSIHWRGQELFLGESLAGEPVALEQHDDRFYQIYFGPIPLARFDDAHKKLLRPPTSRRKRP